MNLRNKMHLNSQTKLHNLVLSLLLEAPSEHRGRNGKLRNSEEGSDAYDDTIGSQIFCH